MHASCTPEHQLCKHITVDQVARRDPELVWEKCKRQSFPRYKATQASFLLRAAPIAVLKHGLAGPRAVTRRGHRGQASAIDRC